MYFCRMRWLKYGILIMFLLGVVYAVSMFFVDESKNFTIEKEVSYPVDKVFPQFNNLQNFSRWNTVFSDNKNMSVEFFSPYEGIGSSMKYQDRSDDDIFGDIFIRYENPQRTLKFQLFEGKGNTPYVIDLKFIPDGERTKVIWYIHTPKQPLLKRSLNLVSEDFYVESIDKSMKKLHLILGNKVDKDTQRENMKFDTLMVEEQESQLLLGVNVSTKNSKDGLFRNIVINHNKVLNYVKMDLAKRDDEYGEPVIITDADNFKDKDVSYFYGIPLSKKEGVTDNNFTFRTLNASRNYVMFYQGAYANRIKSIQQIIDKAKKDTLRTGDLQQTFLEEPGNDSDVILKLSIPVFR